MVLSDYCNRTTRKMLARHSYVYNNPLNATDPSGFGQKWIEYPCPSIPEPRGDGPATALEVIEVTANRHPCGSWVDIPDEPGGGGAGSRGGAGADEITDEVTVTGTRPQSRSLQDKVTEQACKLGNWFARRSSDLGKASSAAVIGGLTVSASSVLFGPEMLGAGGAMTASGGYLGWVAGGAQFVAGGLQTIAGAANHNMRNSLVTIGGGMVANKALTGLGRTTGGAAAQAQLDRASTQVGGLYDAVTGFLDDMAPSEVSCGGH
jgi:hypothetical protein